MVYVLQTDSNYRNLYELKQSSSDDIQSITYYLGNFRKSLSLSWLKRFVNHEPVASLSHVIRTMFWYCEHEYANVRVTSYGIVGALLVTLTPFDSWLMIKSYGAAITNYPISSRSSIAIINSFVFLSKYVPQVKMQDFLVYMPIIPYLESDVSDFLKYLPNSILDMGGLPFTIHERLLESIFKFCSSTPSSAFTNSIYNLMIINESLIEKLLPYLDNPNFNISFIHLCTLLFTKNRFFEGFKDEGQEKVFQIALRYISLNPLQFVEFECACVVCSLIIRNIRHKKDISIYRQRIIEVIPEAIPSHYQRLLLLLPISYQDIMNFSEISDSLKSAKISALGNLVLYYDDGVDVDRIAEYFLKFKDTFNDLYCSLVDTLTKCISIFFSKCKCSYHIELIQHLLGKENKNWVHDMSIVGLIEKLPQDKCEHLIPNYIRSSCDTLLRLQISPTKKLSNAALQTICKITSYRFIDYILQQVIGSNWVDDNISSHRFKLLCELSRIFPRADFTDFRRIAFECICFHESVYTLANIYSFLKNVEIEVVPDNVYEISISFIMSSYESYTQSRILVPDSLHIYNELPQSYIESFDTDIVSNPTFSHLALLNPVFECFEFIYRIPTNSIRDFQTILWMSISLIPIFGKKAIEKSSDLIMMFPEHRDMFYKIITEVILSVPKEEVLAASLKIILQDLLMLSTNIRILSEKILSDYNTITPELLFFAFKISQAYESSLSKNIDCLLSKNLNAITGTHLFFQISELLDISYLSLIPEDYQLSFIGLANQGNLIAQSLVSKYIDKHALNEWPLLNNSFCFELKCFLKRISFNSVNNFPEIDENHLDFLTQYDPEIIYPYFCLNPQRFAKIFIPKIWIFYSREFPLLNIEHTATISKELPYCSVRNMMGCFYGFARILPIEMINDIFDTIIKSNDICSLSLFAKYLIRTEQKIDTRILIQNASLFFKDHIIYDTLRFFGVFNSFKDIPLDLISILAKDPGFILNVDSFLSIQNFVFIKSLAIISPNSFLNSLIIKSVSKMKYIKIILSTMFETEYECELLHDYISQLILILFNDIKTQKKSLIFRLVTVSIQYFKSKKHNDEIHSVFTQLSQYTDLITDWIQGCLLSEISFLMNSIIINSNQLEIVYDFLNTLNSYEELPFLFFCSVYLRIKKPNYHIRGTHNPINYLEYGFPSISYHTIRSMNLLISPYMNLQIYGGFESYIYIISQRMREYSANFRTCASVIPFISKVIMNKDLFGIQGDLLMNFTSVFLSNTSSPAFSSSIPLFNQLFSLYPSMKHDVFQIEYCNSEIIDILSVVLSNHHDITANAIKYFFKFPTVEFAESIAKEIQESRIEEVINTSFSPSQNVIPFLVLFKKLSNNLRDTALLLTNNFPNTKRKRVIRASLQGEKLVFLDLIDL